jgi:hypothetical protein
MDDIRRRSPPTVAFELRDPAVAKDPGDYFRRLRTQSPVAWTDDLGGCWILSTARGCPRCCP